MLKDMSSSESDRLYFGILCMDVFRLPQCIDKCPKLKNWLNECKEDPDVQDAVKFI